MQPGYYGESVCDDAGTRTPHIPTGSGSGLDHMADRKVNREMERHSTEVLTSGLAFPEGPRWRDNLLWFSDMHGREVRTVDVRGRGSVVVKLQDRPSGLGWLPSDVLLVVSMDDRRVLAWDGVSLEEHADLSDVAPGRCNDMLVDSRGNAYVGNFGFDLFAGGEPKSTVLALVGTDGAVSIAAEDLLFPNGMVLFPDRSTLVVGETFGARLTAFDVDEGGRLSGRRVWAALEDGHVPDGICPDADGAVWVASPTTGVALRVLEGGEVTDIVEVSEGRAPYACMLGGPDGRTLFCCTSSTMFPEEAAAQRGGAIEAVEVPVPHDGLP